MTDLGLEEESDLETWEAINHLINHLLPSGTIEQVPALKDTPARVAKMYRELTSGYGVDTKEILKANFMDDSMQSFNGIVIVKDIPVFSLCEHHMIPFFGVAHVGYIPGQGKASWTGNYDSWNQPVNLAGDSPKLVGLSKLSRLVNAYARRLQVQERLTQQVADDLDEYLHPKGAMVVIQATHLCMVMRGAQAHSATTVTSSLKGVFEDDAAARSEFLSLVNLGR